MIRQFNVVVDNEVVGKFTIHARRGDNLGWTAQAKFTAPYRGSWTLDRSPEFTSKESAILWAGDTIRHHQAIDGYGLVARDKTQWQFA